MSRPVVQIAGTLLIGPILLLAAMACGSETGERPDSGADASSGCVEGHSRECTCPDDSTGVQICGAEGAWGECICGSNGAGADGTADSPDAGRDTAPADGVDDPDADSGTSSPDDSPHEKDVSLPTSCESGAPEVAVLDESDDLQAALNDSDKRIFCVKPGDYRDQNRIFIKESGSAQERRYLWFYDPDDSGTTHPWHLDDPETKTGEERALLPKTHLRSSYWTIDRIRFADGIKVEEGASHNILNRLMLYRRSLNTTDGAVSVKLRKTKAITVQNSVIARSESGYDCGHGSGSVGVELLGVEDTTIVGNEIFDMYCEDLIQAATYGLEDPRIRGTVIADNDLYLTSEYAGNKPVENAIDMKAGPAEPGSSSVDGVPKEEWTLIENNRIWNWYGGGDTWTDRYGPTGPVNIFHITTTSGVIFRGNAVWDAGTPAHKIIMNDVKGLKNNHFVVEENLVYDTAGGFEPQDVDDSTYERNIVVDADKDGNGGFYWGDRDDEAHDNTIRHNVFLESDVGVPVLDQFSNQVGPNAFYDSTPFDSQVSGDIVEENAGAANHADAKVRVKRITDPQTVTIPHGAVTDQSPHSDWFD